MKSSSYAVLVVAMLGGMCRRTPPPAPPPASESATQPGEPTPASSYRVVAVDHGGSLQGRVTWRGERPPTDAMPVHATGNPTVCGTTQPFPALTVDATGGVQGAVVWLKDLDHGVAQTVTSVTVDQHQCRYEPHITAMPLGADLRMTNSDPGLLHNVHAYYGYAGEESWFNAATPVGLPVVRRADRTGVSRIICDAGHTWMVGYVHVFDHPYFAVTDARGAWTIRNVPPGTYTLHTWHEGFTMSMVPSNEHPGWSPAWEHDQQVTVAPDGNVTVDQALTLTGWAG